MILLLYGACGCCRLGAYRVCCNLPLLLTLWPLLLWSLVPVAVAALALVTDLWQLLTTTVATFFSNLEQHASGVKEAVNSRVSLVVARRCAMLLLPQTSPSARTAELEIVHKMPIINMII